MYIWFSGQIIGYNVVSSPDDCFVASDDEVHEEICSEAWRRGHAFTEDDLKSPARRHLMLGSGEIGRLQRYEECLAADSVC